KGKRIGASVGATDEALLKAMLATVGLKLTDVTVTEVNFQLEQALMSHRVDAIIGGMRNYEMIDLQQRGLKPVGFFPEEHGVPLYDELILLARQDDEHDPRIGRFLAALQEGTNTLLNHPDEMWQAFIKERPELDTKLNHAAWFAGLPRLAKNPALLDQSRYAAFEQFMVAQGSLATAQPVASFAIQP
ncbi:MAG: ABC transporter substrate-binding protein, partial [Janthinobacterium lividum]